MIGQNSNMRSKMRNAAAALVGASAALLAASAAEAQSTFWDWGGSQTVGGAGKQTVRFPANYRPGELIVSFGDRRVYHVTGPGVASAYPIAIPREQSRWQGVTAVTSKRENPSWTPTAHMRAENPRLPTWEPLAGRHQRHVEARKSVVDADTDDAR
jgi:lipoprotein-anchoring transpeptidase ErfK/SrfK